MIHLAPHVSRKYFEIKQHQLCFVHIVKTLKSNLQAVYDELEEEKTCKKNTTNDNPLMMQYKNETKQIFCGETFARHTNQMRRF